LIHFLVLFAFIGWQIKPAQAAADIQPPGVAVPVAPAQSEDKKGELQLPWVVANYVRMTLERHPELLIFESQSLAAEGQFREAVAHKKPQLALGGNGGFQKQKIETAGLSNRYRQTQAQVRLSVPLIDAGLAAQIEQRRSAAAGADWRLLDKREDLMLRTLEAYIEILRATRLRKLSQDNLLMHRDYVRQVKAIARLDLGRAADLQAAMGRVALAEAVNTSRLARLELARLEFQSLTGLSRLQEMPALPRFVPAPSLDEAYQAALKSSAALQVARADIEAARQGVLLARSPYQPRVNLDAAAKTGRDWGGIKGSQKDLYVGVQAEWTIFSSGAQDHAIKAANATETAHRYAFEKARDELQLRVSTAWYEFLANSQSLNSYSDYVGHAETMVDTTRKQFRIGRRNLLDVLNAENELFTARSNQVVAELDQIQSALRLAGLQGQLTAMLGL
jgi:outer membrane protein, adhesin transport system